VQACLYLAKKQAIQNVHNIIIAEEGSELHIITGCTVAPRHDPGLHLGVSELYIKKGAKVTFTMIHNWNPEVAVRPRTGVIVEENGLYISNYVMMKPVGSLQMNPTARCIGENAIVRFNSILVAPEGSNLDIGSRAILDAKGCRTEIVSRAITTGGYITARGYIEGNAPDVKGHLECRGLIMGKGGTMYAIPELMGTLDGIDLSHEAAVGKIAEEEVEYMMARGLTRTEATATIVRGFLRVDIEGLPPALNAELKKAVEESEKDLM
jgi:Fe-S cluster assembly scaffold protein SufB